MVATFSDVPYILDSVWRWSEFRIYRLGLVTAWPSHDFSITATTPWPFYVAFLVISSLLVFGPTLTTFCVSFGWWPAQTLRVLLGASLMLATLLVMVTIVSAVVPELAKRVASISIPVPEAAREPPKLEPQLQLAITDFVARGRAIGEALRQRFQSAGAECWEMVQLLPQQFTAFRQGLRGLPRQSYYRILWAAAFLFLGASVMFLPIAFAGSTIITNPYERGVCTPAHVGRGIGQLAVFAVVVYLGALLWTRRDAESARLQLWWVSGFWFGAAVILWLISVPKAHEATGGPYLQTYAVLLACLLAVALLSRPLAVRIMAGVDKGARRSFRQALKTTQLFAHHRSDPELSGWRVLASIVNGVIYHPLHLLLLPSLVAIMLPTRLLVLGVSGFTALAVLLLAHGSVAVRWQELIELVRRWFLSGTPFLISIAVITLAVLRLFDVQYVATILDAAPVGTVLALVVGAYMTLWFIEYWINRWLAEQLLRVLGAGKKGLSGYVPYPNSQSPDPQTPISGQGRVIALQSLGEFCVQGWFNDRQGRFQHAFTTYSLAALFQRLAPGTPAAHDVDRRIKFYFAIVNLALLLLGAGLYTLQRYLDRPVSAYSVVKVDESQRFAADAGDLAAALLRQGQQRRPALIVAASGGGTRAALYTATALEGLAKIGRTGDIVLLSGVSGGGVAAAYFAGHSAELSRQYASATRQWGTYKTAVTEPFIEDVLDGVDELRIAGSTPLGQLLAESLERRVFKGPVQTFQDLTGPALILNATISGHPWRDSEILRDHLGIAPSDTCAALTQPFASLAGSRLIFTNLRDTAGFPRQPMIMPDVGFYYRIIRDPTVALSAAAALNANFPPVFSNARVLVTSNTHQNCDYSYYVTDGGATENLGLVSALYELQGLLDRWKDDPRSAHLAPPQMHIIAIEASAVTYDYTEDRGVGAATGGAKERINGGLTQQLIDRIDAQLAALGAPPLKTHYIPLPLAFRSRGGFGTHWMYAKLIRVSNPLVPRLGNRIEQWWRPNSYVNLEHKDIDALWSALFDPAAHFCTQTLGSSATEQVREWICGRASGRGVNAPQPDGQIAAWATLVKDLDVAREPAVSPR